MDWEWPIDTGDKKDKIKLIRYMRVSCQAADYS